MYESIPRVHHRVKARCVRAKAQKPKRDMLAYTALAAAAVAMAAVVGIAVGCRK